MICCDICRKELSRDRTRMSMTWTELMETAQGHAEFTKEPEYDLCADCRKAVLKHMAEMKAAREEER